eukprot:20875-Amphidinium_carterae.1
MDDKRHCTIAKGWSRLRVPLRAGSTLKAKQRLACSQFEEPYLARCGFYILWCAALMEVGHRAQGFRSQCPAHVLLQDSWRTSACAHYDFWLAPEPWIRNLNCDAF